mmetsp:Transcript_54937/g.117907  ORF Transcript_54937/g.117907 Transcript_54937/m.117907 type:complete len:312 (+) Transcript_54937:82-1017(+)
MSTPRSDACAGGILTAGCDGLSERDLLRKAAEAERRAKGAIEKRRRAVGEQRKELEAKVTAAHETLRIEKEAALAIHSEVSLERWERQKEVGSATTTCSEVEETATAVLNREAELAAARLRAEDQAREARESLEISGSIYQMYAAATGIHFDVESGGETGYIALDTSARPFEVGGLGSFAAANTIWGEVEACLPLAALAPLAPAEVAALEPAQAVASSPAAPSPAASSPTAPSPAQIAASSDEEVTEETYTERTGSTSGGPSSGGHSTSETSNFSVGSLLAEAEGDMERPEIDQAMGAPSSCPRRACRRRS